MKKVKLFFTVLLFLIIGAFVLRVIISSDKSLFDDFVVSEDTRAAYAEHGSLTVRRMDLKNLISEYGYFSAYYMYFVEETGELQVAVRYNVSALNYTDTESDGQLDFRLLIRDADAAEDDVSIGAGDSDEEAYDKNDILYSGTYYTADEVEEKSRYGIYRFRRLTFKNVELTPEELINADMLVVMTDKSAESVTSGSASSYAGYYDRQYIHHKGLDFDPFEVPERKLKAK